MSTKKEDRIGKPAIEIKDSAGCVFVILLNNLYLKHYSALNDLLLIAENIQEKKLKKGGLLEISYLFSGVEIPWKSFNPIVEVRDIIAVIPREQLEERSAVL